jgi:hypothetical protein
VRHESSDWFSAAVDVPRKLTFPLAFTPTLQLPFSLKLLGAKSELTLKTTSGLDDLSEDVAPIFMCERPAL